MSPRAGSPGSGHAPQRDRLARCAHDVRPRERGRGEVDQRTAQGFLVVGHARVGDAAYARGEHGRAARQARGVEVLADDLAGLARELAAGAGVTAAWAWLEAGPADRFGEGAEAADDRVRGRPGAGVVAVQAPELAAAAGAGGCPVRGGGRLAVEALPLADRVEDLVVGEQCVSGRGSGRGGGARRRRTAPCSCCRIGVGRSRPSASRRPRSARRATPRCGAGPMRGPSRRRWVVRRRTPASVGWPR